METLAITTPNAASLSKKKVLTSIIQTCTAKNMKTDTSSDIEIHLYLEVLEDSDLQQAIIILRKKLQAQATGTATVSAKVMTTTVHASATVTETMDSSVLAMMTAALVTAMVNAESSVLAMVAR